MNQRVNENDTQQLRITIFQNSKGKKIWLEGSKFKQFLAQVMGRFLKSRGMRSGYLLHVETLLIWSPTGHKNLAATTGWLY